MELDERRARILSGQHLTAPGSQETVCRDLLGVQAQFWGAAEHALTIRTRGLVQPDALVKSWTTRGTVHLFDPGDLPLFLHEGRRHALRPVDRMEADEFITLERKELFARLILDELSRGARLREELRAACQAAGMTPCEERSVFDGWGGLLRALAEAGRTVHRPGPEKAFQLCPPFTPVAEGPARLELARRYFTHYGPATVKDAAYFFGRPQRDVKLWMAQLPLSHARVDGEDCFWLDDGRTDWPDVPPCLFLAGFDQLMLGYEKTRSIFLPSEYMRDIFSRAGIVMAPILLRGRVAGRWKRKDNRLELTAFGAWTRADRNLVQTEAQRLWPLQRIIWPA